MHGATSQGRTPIYESGMELVQAEYHPVSVPQVSPDASQNDKFATEPTCREYDEGAPWHRNEDQQSHALVSEGQGIYARAGKTKSTRKRKWWIALAMGLLVIIIVAATVGGVIGSRAKQTQDEALEYAASPDISNTTNWRPKKDREAASKPGRDDWESNQRRPRTRAYRCLVELPAL